jgi:hypothetical protein
MEDFLDKFHISVRNHISLLAATTDAISSKLATQFLTQEAFPQDETISPADYCKFVNSVLREIPVLRRFIFHEVSPNRRQDHLIAVKIFVEQL